MDKNTYTLVDNFECCGERMVTVIIKDRVACVMPEVEEVFCVTEEKMLQK